MKRPGRVTVRQPVGRFGTPEEIAEFARYLASDLSGYATRQCFVIDGGWTMQAGVAVFRRPDGRYLELGTIYIPAPAHALELA